MQRSFATTKYPSPIYTRFTPSPQEVIPVGEPVILHPVECVKWVKQRNEMTQIAICIKRLKYVPWHNFLQKALYLAMELREFTARLSVRGKAKKASSARSESNKSLTPNAIPDTKDYQIIRLDVRQCLNRAHKDWF